MHRRLLVAAALVLALAGTAAADTYVDGAKQKLDDVEAKLAELAAGDVGGANTLIRQINLARRDLNLSRERGSDGWKVQLERAQDLDAKVRARAAGEGGGDAPADSYIADAERRLDDVEAKLKDLAAGDVGGANRLVRAINTAKGELGKSQARSSSAWKEQWQRAVDLDKAVRARASEEGEGPEPDSYLEDATRRLDDVEAKLAKLAPGDVHAANGLIRAVNSARTVLGRSQLRGSAIWQVQLDRATALDAKARERAAEQPAAAEPEEPAAEPAGPAGPKPLAYVDKRNLGFFDRDLERTRANLEAAAPAALQAPRERVAYERRLRQLEDLLGRVSDQEHPEVVARRKQLEELQALYASKVEASSEALSSGDRRNLERFAQEYEEAMKALVAEAGTVLAHEGDSRYAAWAKRLAGILDGVANQGHDDVEAARQELERYAELLAEKEVASRAELEKLGDVQARLDAYWKAFYVKAFPPLLPSEATADVVRAWCSKLNDWQGRLDEAVAYLERVQRWAPLYEADVELGNRVRRFLGERPHQLRTTVEQVLAYWKETSEAGAALDIDVYSEEELAKGVWQARECLEKAARCAELHAAYHEARFGAPDAKLAGAHAALEAKLQDFNQRSAIAAQNRIDSARMPESIDDAELLAIAERVIKFRYRRLVVYRGKRHHTRTTVHHDGFAYREDYDVFWAATAEEIDGKWWIVHYCLCYSRLGVPGDTLNEWCVAQRVKDRQILEEHIDE